MLRLPSWHRFPDRSTIVFSGIALLLFLVEHVNGRAWMNDFRVYWGAADALLHGEPLYGVAHGLDSGVFKYAPIMAVLFVPFALLPYPLAAAIHFGLIVWAFIAASIRVDQLIRKHLLHDRAPSYAPLFITALVVVVHLHRELHLGNINMILLAVLLIAIERLLKGRTIAAGVLLGIVMLAKPHFFVLLPLLLLRSRFHALGVVLLTIGLGILAPSAFLGVTESMDLHGEWLGQMASHNAGLIYSGGSGYEAVNTLYSFLHRSVLRHLGASGSSVEAYAILSAVAVAYGAFVLRNLWLERRTTQQLDRSFLVELFLLIALVPSITLTDTEHFLFAMPLVAYVVLNLLPKPAVPWLLWIAIPVLFAYGGNWEDALGSLSDVFIHHGVLGIGNLGLIILAICLFLRGSMNPTTMPVSNDHNP
jgi:hypothetical protein